MCLPFFFEVKNCQKTYQEQKDPAPQCQRAEPTHALLTVFEQRFLAVPVIEAIPPSVNPYILFGQKRSQANTFPHSGSCSDTFLLKGLDVDSKGNSVCTWREAVLHEDCQ